MTLFLDKNKEALTTIDVDTYDDNDHDHISNWNKVKLELKNDFKSIIWNSWIGPLQFLAYKNFILEIATSSELVKNRIEHQYYEQIFVKSKTNFI